MSNKALLSVIFFGFSFSFASPVHWSKKQEHLYYATAASMAQHPNSRIVAFRVNPKFYRFAIQSRQKSHERMLYASNGTNNGALIAINGGYFNTDFQPLGLRISDGILHSSLRKISWWGIFFITNHHAKIQSIKKFHTTKNIQFAIETGPQLIINGKIPALYGSLKQRSALCITSNGEVIIAITQHLLVTLKQFSHLLQNNFGCHDAINLDGGSSSQLSAHIGNFRVNITSIFPVADLVTVTALKGIHHGKR